MCIISHFLIQILTFDSVFLIIINVTFFNLFLIKWPKRCTDLSSHWFAVFPMRMQDEYLTSFREDLWREASGSNELGSAAALGVPVLFAHP
jgi:hypothetical protein